MFFYCFTLFFGCYFIKFIDRTHCKVRKNVLGTVSEMSANSRALVFCFTNLLSVDGHSMSEGIPGLTNIVFSTSCICYNVD